MERREKQGGHGTAEVRTPLGLAGGLLCHYVTVQVCALGVIIYGFVQAGIDEAIRRAAGRFNWSGKLLAVHRQSLRVDPLGRWPHSEYEKLACAPAYRVGCSDSQDRQRSGANEPVCEFGSDYRWLNHWWP